MAALDIPQNLRNSFGRNLKNPVAQPASSAGVTLVLSLSGLNKVLHALLIQQTFIKLLSSRDTLAIQS